VADSDNSWHDPTVSFPFLSFLDVHALIYSATALESAETLVLSFAYVNKVPNKLHNG